MRGWAQWLKIHQPPNKQARKESCPEAVGRALTGQPGTRGGGIGGD